jgi:hypothetical protein
MFNALGQAMDEADSNVKEWQKAIKKGDCFKQWIEYGFYIYGKVLRNASRAKRLQHYRFCFCFSEDCPDGERGDIHVSVVTELIDQATFDEIFAGHNNGRKPPF